MRKKTIAIAVGAVVGLGVLGKLAEPTEPVSTPKPTLIVQVSENTPNPTPTPEPTLEPTTEPEPVSTQEPSEEAPVAYREPPQTEPYESDEYIEWQDDEGYYHYTSTDQHYYDEELDEEYVIVGGPDVDAPYIGNGNSYKFHHNWCESVDDMDNSNKVAFESAEEAREYGYTPCKRCNP